MYYIAPDKLAADNTFLLQCGDYEVVLDTKLTILNNLKFTQLQKICKEVKVRARHRHYKKTMIAEIQRYITLTTEV